MRVLVVVDNLRIGGIQRLALDQMYFLHDLGVTVSLVVFAPDEINHSSFFSKERDYIYSKSNKLYFISNSLVGRFIDVFKVVLQSRPDLIISHSVRGTPFFRVVRPLLKASYHITLTIHQFPSFSRWLQMMKIFIFCRFSDSLFSFSVPVARQWEDILRNNHLLRILYRSNKPTISVVRNGIYPARLSDHKKREIKSDSGTRIIYMGRLKAWKGIHRIRALMLLIQRYENCRVLILTPSSNEEVEKTIPTFPHENFEIVLGETIAYYLPMAGDIHIFPVDYGSSPYTESVSISCLEMSYMGIPSLITKNGMETWPELLDSNLFYEVDWDSSKSIIAQLELISRNKAEGKFLQHRVRSIVDIKHNICVHLSTIGVSLNTNS